MPWPAATTSASVFPVLEPASEGARDINLLLYQLFGLSAVIFLITGGLIVIAMIRSARATGEADPTPVEGGSREIHWMIGPTLVVIWLLIVSAKLILSINVMHADAPGEEAFVARGHQWYWAFSYPGTEVTTANQLHIPAGERHVLRVASADVVHSFWAPRLGRKMDAIPGRDNYIYLQAEEPGTYEGFCSEYCGTQHAWMLFEVIAHEPAEYERWLAAQGQPAPPVTPGTPAAAGRKIFEQRTCTLCHTVRGHGAAGAEIGPDLTHFASRTIIAGGVAPLTEADVRRWLHDPGALKPGTKMPNFKFTDDELDAVVAYLMSLQ